MAEIAGIQLDPRTPDNKVIVQSTSRPIGTYSCFTSEGDNTSHSHLVGGGHRFINYHEVGDSTVSSFYVDFNTIENITYLHEGYGLYTSAYFDTINLEVVPTITPVSPGTNTYFNLYNGYLIIPAAGDGSVEVNSSEMKLVEIPISLDNPLKRQAPAFWDATWNTSLQKFENLTPAPLGDGTFNMFASEVIMQKPVNMCLIGSGNIVLKTTDIAQIGHGIRLKLTFITGTTADRTDHDWNMSVILALHREHSSNF